MASLYLGDKQLNVGGGGEEAYVLRIDEQNVDYGAVLEGEKAGAWDILTNPPTEGVRVSFYAQDGSKIAERTTNAAGTVNVDIITDVASLGVTKNVPGDQNRGDGNVSAIAEIEVQLRRLGTYLPQRDYGTLDVYKSTEQIRRSGSAMVLIVGGGMDGQASAGGTSVGAGGRTGRIKVIPFAKFTGTELVTVSAAVPFGSPDTAGVSSVGPYSSVDGTFAPALVSTNDPTTMPWSTGKVYGDPIIRGSAGSGIGGSTLSWIADNGGYRIGQGGACMGGSNPDKDGKGNGSGGGGGFWNGSPGGAGGPGAVFIQWLD